MTAAIFLDRDGVIIENRDTYVRSWADVAFLPGSLEALARLSSSSYKIVIVTNQSAVGRGIISIQTAEEISRRIIETIVEHGGRIDGVFMCPHAPDAGCDCRKPRPGLFFQAATALAIDLSVSCMIGDAVSDLAAGQNAGIRKNYLVRTGRGAVQALRPEAASLQSFTVCDSLADVVGQILASPGYPTFH